MKRHHSPARCRLVLIVGLSVCVVTAAAADALQEDDDVVRRCYCNEPACVKTGYMCKTSFGACFAQRAPANNHVRYACAHWLANHADRRLCLISAGADSDYVIRRHVTSSWTELVCCSTDMCNYYYFRSPLDVDIRANNVSTDPLQQLQQRQQDDVTSSSSSSSRCLQSVVMVTVSLCVVVLVTLAVVVTLYALSARRRRMTSSPAAAFPLPVAATRCRCGGGADRRNWLMGCSSDDYCKSMHHHRQQRLVNCADPTSQDARHDDERRPADVAATSPSPTDHQPLKPTSNHSESTLLLVARDAWTS